MLPTGPRAGGAPFNFAFHCQQLGYPAYIVSRLGADALGEQLRAEVRRLGMSDHYIQTDPTAPTGTVAVAVDRAGQPTYTIAQPVAWDYLAWDEALAELAAQAVAVCYGTLAQRQTASRATLTRFLAAVPATTPRICDINMRPTAMLPDVWRHALAGCTWLKLNHDELLPLAAALGVAPQLESLAPTKLVCLTRGADGCSLATPGHAPLHIPGRRVQVVDTVGAGDAFTAALVVRTLQGASLPVAAEFANAYAALVAASAGGTPVFDRATITGLS
jgi:fructokinase